MWFFGHIVADRILLLIDKRKKKKKKRKKNNLTNKQTEKINKEYLIKRQENRIKTKETKINEKPKSRSRKLMNMAYNVRY